MTKPLLSIFTCAWLRLSRAGMSRRAAAERFGVAVSAAIKWHRLWRRTGTVALRPQGGDRHSHRIEALAQAILGLVAQTPDITLAEIAGHLERNHGERFTPSVIHRFFVRRGISFKKNTHAAEQDRPEVARRRHLWFDLQQTLDPERLVFIDETGASTKMARLYGRARRGERCCAPLPHGHWKTTTFTGALRFEGLTAPMVLDGPMNAATILKKAAARAIAELWDVLAQALDQFTPADCRNVFAAAGYDRV